MHQDLHGNAKESKIYGEIEIETFVFNFMLPDRFTEENLELKKEILDCNKKEIFRTGLIQSYINEDWIHFA